MKIRPGPETAACLGVSAQSEMVGVDAVAVETAEVVVETAADVRRAGVLGLEAAQDTSAARSMPLSASLAVPIGEPQPPNVSLRAGAKPIPLALVAVAGLVIVALILLSSAALLAWRSRASSSAPTPG